MGLPGQGLRGKGGQVNGIIHEVAERILTLGATPLHTFDDYKITAKIKSIKNVSGVLVIIQSAMKQQWFGVLFGGYFAEMGLFTFGYATGNCFSGNCKTELNKKEETK